ncbi:Gp138 family membrane-puncturing spike protein [Brevibacillus laterosporus]|uniref:Gp138 family membrane-puncturing spike protein n=1 Tax=Brevibacillus laterosporus TaxID=1465 RepID=UPI000839D5D5|nr:Gp138 family membrane-puncturing spike protein [Brevibacillus laterosporus]
MDEVLKDWLESELRQLHTATVAKVVTYDKATRRASVQPLIKQKVKGKGIVPLPLLEGVPVLKQHFEVAGMVQEYLPVLQPGQIVLLVFSERAIDHALKGEHALPNARRRHSLSDAVVVGVLG